MNDSTTAPEPDQQQDGQQIDISVLFAQLGEATFQMRLMGQEIAKLRAENEQLKAARPVEKPTRAK